MIKANISYWKTSGDFYKNEMKEFESFTELDDYCKKETQYPNNHIVTVELCVQNGHLVPYKLFK